MTSHEQILTKTCMSMFLETAVKYIENKKVLLGKEEEFIRWAAIFLIDFQ